MDVFSIICHQLKWLKKLKWRHWVLIALLLIILFIKSSVYWSLEYTFRFYPYIGWMLSHISGIFPFAIGDLFIALSISWVILYPVYQICIKKKLIKKGWLRQDATLLKKRMVFCHVAEYLLWVYAWFYLAWGLNYSQPIIFVRMRMMPAKVSKQTLRDFANRYVDSINYLSESISYKDLKKRTQDEVLHGYNQLPLRMGINSPFNQHPRVKTMVFTPLSSMAGVTGSMGPFFCEFTLNGDILPHDYPATYAHEFAHFLGVANEGEANLYSYIVCTASADKQVRFSGYYHIFFHVLNNVFDILGEKEGERFLKHIRPEIIQLAKSDRRYWLGKRCKALDATQDFIFELYLRGNHVAEGRKSYSGVIGLILAWEERILKEKMSKAGNKKRAVDAISAPTAIRIYLIL